MMRTQFAGADWIKRTFKKELSPLGENVANLLGDLFGGIYHIDHRALSRVDWANDHHIILILGWQGLSTYDMNELTRLVFLCHDYMLRCSISGTGPKYIEMMFHQRQREGDLYQRHPTIEQALEDYRKSHPIETQP